jgi:hypothetical protein
MGRTRGSLQRGMSFGIPINTATAAMTIMTVRIRMRIGGIGIPSEQNHAFPASA